MTPVQITIFAVLAGMLAMFIWGRWRHDMVALAALLVCVVAGLIPADAAFAGFGHPAVITVACVLILSRSLQTTGAVDALTRRLLPREASPQVTLAALTALAAALSAVMNNVGALALLMPVAIQAAQRCGLPTGQMLMPLAFGSILGGMTTLIGTPPNLIVSAFRVEAMGSGFGMFSFTPVGLAVAAAGVAFISLAGWRLVPARKRAGFESFDTASYMTEARVPDGARAHGKSLSEIEEILAEIHAQVLGLLRDDMRLTAPSQAIRVREGDILMIEAEPEDLAGAMTSLGLRLEEDKNPHEQAEAVEPSDEDDTARPDEDAGPEGAEARLVELVVGPTSRLIGRTARAIGIRERYGINLLALSREGRRSVGRLRDAAFQPGDVLMMQGRAAAVSVFASDFGCLPLAERALRLPDRRRALLAALFFLAAVAVAAAGLATPPVAFAGAVLAVVATGVIPVRSVYDAIDWSVIVLLGCLLPVAGALQATGAADLAAGAIVDVAGAEAPLLSLTLVLIATMTLSDLMNNAATVAVMAPISLGVAAALGANPDAFLMAVAIGGSCAFLTPVGHQNNTLILGPGGFRFGDYWRLGLPLEMLVLVISVPMIVLVWGL